MAKQPTEKQLAARKAASERMKARHAAIKAQKEAVEQEPTAVFDALEDTVQEVNVQTEVPKVEEISQSPQPAPGVSLTNEQFEMLLQRFSGMSNENKVANVGIIERFPISEKFYNNPIEELYDYPRFRRFSMRENFVIDWKVTPTKYETKQGQWYMEPRFEITLKKKQFDDDGNEIIRTDKFGKPYHPRIVLGRASFFVDPPADMIEAELAGLDDADLTDDELRERMFLWRYASWIEERLSPKLPKSTTNNRREEVIGGKAYEIEEYSNLV